MISDEERREVASRLRALDVHEWDDSADEVDSLETAIGCAIGQDWQDQAWWERLADLIDRPTTTRHGKFRTKYGRETPCCEVCGYSIGDMRWGYCPKCGAVIIDD